MHFRENVDLMLFLMKVKECAGEVFFETPEGDCLALRSALSQYIFGAAVNEKELLQSGTIRCGDPADYAALEAFLQER